MKKYLNSINFKFSCQEIFELFHKLDVENVNFNFGKINEEKVKEILVERHDFSEERVDKQIERLKKIKEEQKQKGLDKWF